jgi:hypothetical protein
VKGMGAAEPSSRIDVQLLDGHRTLADRSGHKDVIIRVRSIGPRPIVARLVARGYSVRDPRKG